MFWRLVITQCKISWNSCQESCNFLKPLVRILTRFLPRAPRICTILQDLAKNFKKNAYFFRLKKRRKRVFSTKNLPGKTENLVKKSKKIQETPRILTRVSREKLTKVNENKQKPTPTSAWSAYLFYHGCSRYQPNYHVLNFNTLCCLISNTSKYDSVAGSANSSKNL